MGARHPQQIGPYRVLRVFGKGVSTTRHGYLAIEAKVL